MCYCCWTASIDYVHTRAHRITHTLHNRLHDKPGTRTLQLGLEEFQEGDFDSTVRRMYAFFGFPQDEVRVCVCLCSP